MNLFKAARCDTNELTVLCCFPWLRRGCHKLWVYAPRSASIGLCRLSYRAYACVLLLFKVLSPFELSAGLVSGQTKAIQRHNDLSGRKDFRKNCKRSTGFQGLRLASKVIRLNFSFFSGGGVGKSVANLNLVIMGKEHCLFFF